MQSQSTTSLTSRRNGAAVAMAIYLALFFTLTLAVFLGPGARPNFIPFKTIRYDCLRGGWAFVVNILGNLAAGFPMGWLLPSLLDRRCSWAKVIGLGFGVSLVIELIQGLSGQRVADVDDLMLNTSGSMMGYAAWLVVDRWSWRQKA